MAPSYKLIYFNARGKAEHIRFIFAYAGVNYEDERISQEKWPELKRSEWQWTIESMDCRPVHFSRKIRCLLVNNGLSFVYQMYIVFKSGELSNNEHLKTDCDPRSLLISLTLYPIYIYMLHKHKFQYLIYSPRL